MWQRIQSLYLFIAIVINLLLFFMDMATISVEGSIFSFDIYGLNESNGETKLSSTVILAVAATLSILFSLVVIFLFKRRQLQIKLGQLNLFIQLVLVVVMFFVMDNVINYLYPNTEAMVEYGLGTFVSWLPLLFIYLAIKAIKKDEALIRAADRIR